MIKELEKKFRRIRYLVIVFARSLRNPTQNTMGLIALSPLMLAHWFPDFTIKIMMPTYERITRNILLSDVPPVKSLVQIWFDHIAPNDVTLAWVLQYLSDTKPNDELALWLAGPLVLILGTTVHKLLAVLSMIIVTMMRTPRFPY